MGENTGRVNTNNNLNTGNQRVLPNGSIVQTPNQYILPNGAVVQTPKPSGTTDGTTDGVIGGTTTGATGGTQTANIGAGSNIDINGIYGGIDDAYLNYYDRMRDDSRNAYDAQRGLLDNSLGELEALRRGQYNSSAGIVNENTERAQQQAFINKMMQEKNINQILSAMGRSGGASESTLLGLTNSYGTQRSETDRASAAQIAGLLEQLNTGLASDRVTYNDNLGRLEADYNGILQNINAQMAQAQLQVQLERAQAEMQRQIAAANASARASSAAQTIAPSAWAGLANNIVNAPVPSGTQTTTQTQAPTRTMGINSPDEVLRLLNAYDQAIVKPNYIDWFI